MAAQYTKPSHFVNGWTVVDESTLTEQAKKDRAKAREREFFDHFRIMHQEPQTINVRHPLDPVTVAPQVIPEQADPTGAIQPTRLRLVMRGHTDTTPHYSETTSAGSLFYGDAAKNNSIIEHNLLLQAAAGGGTIQLRPENSHAFNYRVLLIAEHHGIKVMNADNTPYTKPHADLSEADRQRIRNEVGATQPTPALPEGGFTVPSQSQPVPNPDPKSAQDPKDQVISELRTELANLRTEVEQFRRDDIARAGQTSTSQAEHLAVLEWELAETKQQMAEDRKEIERLSSENADILRCNEDLLQEARTTDETLAALKVDNGKLQEEVARLSKPGETKPEESKDKPQAAAEKPKAESEAASRVDHPKYAEAVKIAAQDGVVSIGKLQTRLKLGYSDAEGMLNALEQDGVIGPRGENPYIRSRPLNTQELNPPDPAMLAAVRAQAPQFGHALDVTKRGENKQKPRPVTAAREDVEAAYAKLTGPKTPVAGKGAPKPEAEPALV